MDVDEKEHKSDLIGSVETTVGKVMGGPKQILTLDLTNHGKKKGSISIKAEKQVLCPGNFEIQFNGEKIFNTRYNPMTCSSP